MTKTYMKFSLFLLAVALLLACNPSKRAVYNYLEDVKDSSFRKTVYMAEPVIQKTDQLSIQIYSASTDPKIDQAYNLSPPTGMSMGNTQLLGVLVDQNGNIDYPRIGRVHAEGLTKSQLADTIKAKLAGQLTDPTVVIRFLNFRVTVLGEVKTPGVVNVPSERVSILEAIGLAGDITEYGKIKQVKVLRENNGVREMGQLDLTSKEIFSSPYYQLKQNDVVLVDKSPYRLRQTEQQRVTQQIGFATGIITAIALLFTVFK